MFDNRQTVVSVGRSTLSYLIMMDTVNAALDDMAKSGNIADETMCNIIYDAVVASVQDRAASKQLTR